MFKLIAVAYLGVLGVFAIAPTPEDVNTLLSGRSIVTMIVLAFAAIPTTLILIRWVIKFQRDFTAVYAAENDKLRKRVDELEAEIETKNTTIGELQAKVGRCESRLFMHEITIVAHENTISHLNEIVERRKLKRREENGGTPGTHDGTGGPAGEDH